MKHLALIAVIALAMGCPSEDDPIPQIPDVAGVYTIALTLLDNVTVLQRSPLKKGPQKEYTGWS